MNKHLWKRLASETHSGECLHTEPSEVCLCFCSLTEETILHDFRKSGWWFVLSPEEWSAQAWDVNTWLESWLTCCLLWGCCNHPAKWIEEITTLRKKVHEEVGEETCGASRNFPDLWVMLVTPPLYLKSLCGKRCSCHDIRPRQIYS